MDTEPIAPLIALSRLLDEFDALADELHTARLAGVVRGVVTGFPALDKLIGGTLAPGLTWLHGSPGAGKTAFAWQVAATCGCPCLFVSCEVAPIELLRRLTARHTRTFLGKFRTGELTGADAKQKARAAVASAPSVAILDGMTAFPTSARILESAEVLREQSGAAHVLIVLDSLHTWAAGIGPGEEYSRLAESIGALKAVAARLDAPILGIVERNRQSMESGGLSSGAGNRSIEYSAELVIGMDTTGTAKQSGDAEKPITLRVLKNRHGVNDGTVPLLFNGGFQSFRETPKG